MSTNSVNSRQRGRMGEVSERKEVKLVHITRIEGHLNFAIVIDSEGRVTTRAEALEGIRLLERILVGRHYSEIPDIASRMCGVCHVIHRLTAIKALENAFRIELPEELKLLRELLAIGGTLQSHVLHLFFFVIPDYYNCNSIIDMLRVDEVSVKYALRLKRLANIIVETIGGRAIHTLTPKVGGFTRLPSDHDLSLVRKALLEFKKHLYPPLELIMKLKSPDFTAPTEYVALKGAGLPLLEGDIGCWESGVYKPEEYKALFKPIIENYSTARHYKLDNKYYTVGALARLNVNRDSLPEFIKGLIEQYGLAFPNFSPFANNLAQALELAYFTEKGLEIVGKLLESPPKESSVPYKVEEGVGVAVTEAPRGLLVHSYKLNHEGRVLEADIITPTAQNYKSMEYTARLYVSRLLEENMCYEAIKREVERLIRAYDPCVSCSARFLKEKPSG